jgi:hypothetical protein
VRSSSPRKGSSTGRFVPGPPRSESCPPAGGGCPPRVPQELLTPWGGAPPLTARPRRHRGAHARSSRGIGSESSPVLPLRQPHHQPHRPPLDPAPVGKALPVVSPPGLRSEFLHRPGQGSLTRSLAAATPALPPGEPRTGGAPAQVLGSAPVPVPPDERFPSRRHPPSSSHQPPDVRCPLRMLPKSSWVDLPGFLGFHGVPDLRCLPFPPCLGGTPVRGKTQNLLPGPPVTREIGWHHQDLLQAQQRPRAGRGGGHGDVVLGLPREAPGLPREVIPSPSLSPFSRSPLLASERLTTSSRRSTSSRRFP